MMGSGYLGTGGFSSSSSNLSPLAPPFMVDRTNPKPSSNPLVPSHNWQYSHSSASRPDLYSNLDLEFGSTRTPDCPSASEYGYSGSHSVTSPNSHMPPLNPSVSPATDAFTFLQYSGGVPNNCVEAKQFYPPPVSPVSDNAIPLVAPNEPSYDFLSTSRVAPLGRTSQVDYTQSPWGSIWNRFGDEEQGKRVELDGSFCLGETNDAGSYVCKEYMKQGACTADGLSKCEEASAVSGQNNVDFLGIESQIGCPSTGKLNDKSSSLQDPMFIFGASSRTSISGMRSTLQESHVQVPSLESATNFWSHRNSYNDRMSVKKSSPALVIRPPSIGTSSRISNTVSSEGVAINSKDFGCHNASNQKEALLPSSYGKAGCLDTSRPILHQGFDVPSSSRKEQLANTKDDLDQKSKAGKRMQLPDINVPNGFNLALDTAKGITSVEYSSESLDHYNPAVDSPCWKGAPASRSFSAEASGTLSPQTQIPPTCADDTVMISCQNLCKNTAYQENAYVELGSLLCSERLLNANGPTQESADAGKAGLNYLRPSSNIEVQFSSEIDKSIKECSVPNDSKSDSDLKPSHTKQPALCNGEFISEREFKLCADVADTGLNTNDALEDGPVSVHGPESTKCLSCSAENVSKLAKLHHTEPTPKMNVQMLVNTIQNLSELLLFQCSNDASAVSEQDHDALKLIIKNLDACLSRRIVHSTQARSLPDYDKGVIAGRPLLTKEAGASSQGRFDNRHISGKDVEKIPDFVSLRGNADIVKDDNMVQAIKEVLEEDFNGEAEMKSETLLYKNLWLEAEAALCSITYRARFNRLKIEMEKHKSHNAEDVADSSIKAVEKQLDSEVSPNPNITEKVTPDAKAGPLSDGNIQDPPLSSTTKVVDDVEASALARFHILKSRGEKANSASAEGQQLTFIRDQSEDGSLDVNVGQYSPYCSGDSEVDNFGSYVGWSERETMGLFQRAPDDRVIQSCKKKRLGSQLPAGWCDGSTSDWEHVLKDEFASRN